MEVDEIQTQATKLSRVGDKRNESSKIGHKGNESYPDEEEDRAVIKRARTNDGVANALVDTTVGANSLRGWNHSSRIIRVSRASGGKDRHSKVWTSKGLRDRRVRLSVTTAIQFYDLQDRLGFDQPSKAIEWLIKAADDAIAELPSLNASFPDNPNQLNDENRANTGAEQGFDSAEVELDHQQNQIQHPSLSKSACSSTSETSKNSGLSLSKSDIRANREKARERARERASKEKEKEQESSRIAQQHNTSFTELLTCGIGSVSNNNTSPSPTASSHQNTRHWPVTQMDYFTGLLGPSSSSSRNHSSSSGFPGQIQLGNSMPQQILIPSPFTMSGENHQELQHFSFVPNTDHLTTQAAVPGGDYNLNFTMSASGLAGSNRGTLQSNSPFLPHHHHQLHMFSSIEGSYSSPFYIGPPQGVDNNHQHQFPAGLDGRLHLCYGDGSRTSDHKGKGNN